MDYDGRFMFFGEAVAWAARLNAGLADTQAAVALPSIGGRVIASKGASVLAAFPATLDSATTEVIGVTSGCGYTTSAITSISGLKIAGVLEIDNLNATLTSTHDTKNQSDPVIHLDVNLSPVRLTGAPERTLTLWPCNEYPTYKTPIAPGTPLAAAVTNMGVPLSAKAAPVNTALALMVSPRGVAGAPLSPATASVTLWVLDSPPGTPFSKQTVSPPVGAQLFFGEFAITEGRRRFTTLRIKFDGSAAGYPAGELLVGELSVNGSFHP